MSEETGKTPIRQAISPGKGGVVPPVESRWKKGQSGNANGSSTSGAIARNYLNRLGRKQCTDKKLRKIIADDSKPSLLRSAAEQLLHSRTATTLADFDPWIKGEKTLSELAEAGIDVSIVKSASITKEGRRIELHDRAGENFDRIIRHTDPKDANVNLILRTPADRSDAATEATARLRSLFGLAQN